MDAEQAKANMIIAISNYLNCSDDNPYQAGASITDAVSRAFGEYFGANPGNALEDLEDAIMGAMDAWT